MSVRFPGDQLQQLDRNRTRHVTLDDLPPAGHVRIVGTTAGGAELPIDITSDNIGLAARIFDVAKQRGLGGSVEIPDEILTEGPMSRALLAADSYAASERPTDPARFLDALLLRPDPKVKTFAGGLANRRYPVVSPTGELIQREATYDGKKLYVYVPAHEREAIAELESARTADERYRDIEIVPLSREEIGRDDKRLELRFDKPGVLWVSSRSPAVPEVADDSYLVPGARFGIEAYYHDGRINAEGARSTIDALLQQGDAAKAKEVLSAIRGTVNVFCNQIDAVGKVLNANLTVYSSRSQSPGLTTCIREVWQAWKSIAGDDPVELERAERWARWATDAAIREYREVWMSPPRLHEKTGLSRYVDELPSQAPEEESAHYAGRTWSAEDLRADGAIREHGWDSHPGALALVGPERGQLRQHEMLPVCLNSLLFKYERDFAALMDEFGRPDEAARWREEAGKRKSTMDRLMWDPTTKLYSDLLELPNGSLRKNGYEDLRSYAPLRVGIVEPGSQRAKEMVERIDDFVREYGIATATEDSWEKARKLNPDFVDRCQWGHRSIGWPIATWETVCALREAGFSDKADEIAYRWCWGVQREMEANGGLQVSKHGGFEAPIMEKRDVTADGRSTLAELGYGNQGAGFEGEDGGFRWGYDGYKLLARSLPEDLQRSLARGLHPSIRFAKRVASVMIVS